VVDDDKMFDGWYTITVEETIRRNRLGGTSHKQKARCALATD
jgi:hypothetical protein